MKKHHWKKAAALALVLSLFVSLLSVTAAAEDPDTEGQGCAVGNHTPSEEPYYLNHYKYTVCGGGYADDVVACSVCDAPVNADGSSATYIYGTGEHTPGATYAARRAACMAGYDVDWYICDICLSHVNAETGESLKADDWHEASPHTPSGEKHAANYTPCNGGNSADWYTCSGCGNSVDANGQYVTWIEGTGQHTPGQIYEPDYTDCNGGFKTKWSICTVCYSCLDANGNETERFKGTGNHTLGEKYEANYAPCSGGYKTEWYSCTVCYIPLTADGSEAEWFEGTGVHTPGEEQYEANYTSCYGGYKDKWSVCTTCNRVVDANGKEIDFIGGNGKHQIVSVPAKTPTYEEAGNLAYWQCSVCHMTFANSEGTEYLQENIWLPPLTPDTVVTTEDLETVPESVKNDYDTVESIQEALLETAKTAGFEAAQTNAGSVWLDVTLCKIEEDGTRTEVNPDEFPDDGVTVLLPYPEGTDRSYTFIITHMITHGATAGTIEVLPCTNGEDGIYVHFTSMSPVCISYMRQGSTPAPQTPASASSPTPAASGSSTVPKTSDAAHGAPWGMLALLSIGGLGALSIAGKKLRIF